VVIFGGTERFAEFGARSTRVVRLATRWSFQRSAVAAMLGSRPHSMDEQQDLGDAQSAAQFYVLEVRRAVGKRSGFRRLQLLRRAYALAPRRSVVGVLASSIGADHVGRSGWGQHVGEWGSEQSRMPKSDMLC
jgi:hypothetical protein